MKLKQLISLGCLAILTALTVVIQPSVGGENPTQKIDRSASDSSTVCGKRISRFLTEEICHRFVAGQKYVLSQEYEKSVQEWEKVLSHAEQTNNIRGQLFVLANLGLLYQNELADQDAAISYFQRRLEIAESINHPKVEAMTRSLLGDSYRKMGDFATALVHFEEAANLWSGLSRPIRYAEALTSIGNVYLTLGQYDRSTSLHLDCLERFETAEHYEGQARVLNSLGMAAVGQGEYDAGEDYYQQGLAVVQTALQDDEQALAATQQVNRLLSLKGTLLLHLGTLYHSQNQYQMAMDYYQQGHLFASQIGDIALDAMALNGQGLIHAVQADYSQAIAYHKRVINLLRENDEHHLLGLALTNLGDTLWLSGNLPAAEDTVRQAIEYLESLRITLGDAEQVSLFDTQTNAYAILQQILVQQGNYQTALEVAERGRARAFVNLMTARAESSQASSAVKQSPEKLASKSLSLVQMRQIAQAHQTTLVQYSLIPDDRFMKLGKQRGTYKKLFIWVIKPSGELVFESVSLADIDLKNLIQEGWVSIGARNRASLVLGRPKASRTERDQKLKQLYEILIAPIADNLPQSEVDKVAFIPQGELFLVPFPALQNPTPEDTSKPYLIDRHTTLTAPSIQILDLARQQHQRLNQSESNGSLEPSDIRNLADDDLLIVGNPTMPEIWMPPTSSDGLASRNLIGRYVQLSELPGAEREAKRIADFFGIEAVTNDDATEGWVKQQMQDRRILHFATHGLLDYGNPTESGFRDVPGAIALAPVDAEGTVLPGLLTAAEIIEMDLQAELVVLSACYTGLGTITGDGVIGLSRAFMTAGVPSLVVSLWSVPDAPTAELMTRFYEHLLDGNDKAQALRQAMLETKDNHPDPLAWAAFTVIGESE